MELRWQSTSPSRSVYAHFWPWAEQGSQSACFSALLSRCIHIIIESMRSHPQHGSNASSTDFHIGQYRSLLCALCLFLRHPGTSWHSPNSSTSHLVHFHLAHWQLVIYPTDLIFTAMYYPLCTVYCNTVLASLNARSFARGGTGSETRQLNPLSSLVWQPSVAADTDSEETEV